MSYSKRSRGKQSRGKQSRRRIQSGGKVLLMNADSKPEIPLSAMIVDMLPYITEPKVVKKLFTRLNGAIRTKLGKTIYTIGATCDEQNGPIFKTNRTGAGALASGVMSVFGFSKAKPMTGELSQDEKMMKLLTDAYGKDATVGNNNISTIPVDDLKTEIVTLTPTEIKGKKDYTIGSPRSADEFMKGILTYFAEITD